MRPVYGTSTKMVMTEVNAPAVGAFPLVLTGVTLKTNDPVVPDIVIGIVPPDGETMAPEEDFTITPTAEFEVETAFASTDGVALTVACKLPVVSEHCTLTVIVFFALSSVAPAAPKSPDARFPKLILLEELLFRVHDTG